MMQIEFTCISIKSWIIGSIVDPAEDQSLIQWPRYLPKYLNHWLVSPHTTSKALRTL